MLISRRESLGVIASATLLVPAGTAAKDVPAPPTGVAPGRHTLLPLPFDPKKLRGLSERLLESHWENNYGRALDSLNKVEVELARVTKDTPGYIAAGLRERELAFMNSVILHEQYFANLGGDGKPDGAIGKALGDRFGSLARFEELFRATGASLAGGSGWAILAYNFSTNDLRIHGSGNHTQSLAFGAPLLVMDMYEHSYHIDYGAAAAPYIEAFMNNVHWDEVNRRFERAQRAAAVLGG